MPGRRPPIPARQYPGRCRSQGRPTAHSRPPPHPVAVLGMPLRRSELEPDVSSHADLTARPSCRPRIRTRPRTDPRVPPEGRPRPKVTLRHLGPTLLISLFAECPPEPRHPAPAHGAPPTLCAQLPEPFCVRVSVLDSSATERFDAEHGVAATGAGAAPHLCAGAAPLLRARGGSAPCARVSAPAPCARPFVLGAVG